MSVIAIQSLITGPHRTLTPIQSNEKTMTSASLHVVFCILMLVFAVHYAGEQPLDLELTQTGEHS